MRYNRVLRFSKLLVNYLYFLLRGYFMRFFFPKFVTTATELIKHEIPCLFISKRTITVQFVNDWNLQRKVSSVTPSIRLWGLDWSLWKKTLTRGCFKKQKKMKKEMYLAPELLTLRLNFGDSQLICSSPGEDLEFSADADVEDMSEGSYGWQI